jgi:hypothetical protein
MRTKESAAAEGVRKAWDFYLADHPISIPESIEDAVGRAFSVWLESQLKS